MAEAEGQCRLLSGPAALLAQLLLALLAVGSLAWKRHVEQPQRPLNVWALDVSKQGVSMLAAHICGMLIALIAHRAVTAKSSECAWYFVAFVFDTTLGLAFTIGLHKAALRAARWYGQRATPHPHALEAAAPADGAPPGNRWFEVLQACGNYGDPPSYARWGIQLAEWVACVVAARALCGTLVVLLGPALVHVAQGLDRLFVGHPTLLLYAVMILCPLCLNICQALIQDFVLRWRKGGGGADDDIDGPPSLGERVGSLARRAGSGGSRAAERVASLAKLGGGQAPVEGERQASLLGPLHLRSDAV